MIYYTLRQPQWEVLKVLMLSHQTVKQGWQVKAVGINQTELLYLSM